MTYYPDLSPYEYFRDVEARAGISSLNVGWLDPSHPFPAGQTSAQFKQRLLRLCQSDNEVVRTRGAHICVLDNCPSDNPGPEAWDPTAPVGSSEIRVIGTAAIYAAPVLIHHYVVAHNYRPPVEFIQAVMTGPDASSEEYQALRQRLQPD